ncbi:PREDICTED: calmodulin-like protein 3 [Nicotiana attenuata]|uniref:Calmodulin-like protein 3 n=1 Tax=Nicotiana attenuata TaxID=49451 RepID=A0A1J6IGC6_NICAT|nr:PREDICTED: calmodulin-like protein 3 [Nicotiana attenuata]OIS96790.1 calmodulin-like protein 3 [Nicotiana attenuata]
MSTVLSIFFLAILFIIGLITTLLNFPKEKFQTLIQSISLKSPPLHENRISTTCSSSRSMDEKKVKNSSIKSTSSNNYNKLELRSIFATFDKNNDGYITKQELKLSLKNIGIFIEDKDIIDMVEKVDSNKDGLIDIDEFYQLCHTFLGIEAVNEEEESNREKDLKDAFDVFDYDKDGLISVEELSKILSSLGLRQGKKLDYCKEMISKVDVDGDGMVNFDEFKKMIKGCGTLVPIS